MGGLMSIFRVFNRHYRRILNVTLAALALLSAGLAAAQPQDPRQPVPRGAVAFKGLRFAPGVSDLRLDAYLPNDGSRAPRPAILAFHAGAFTGGDRGEPAEWFMPFVEHGFALFSADYTASTALRSGLPACDQDAGAALSYIINNADRWNIDPRRVVAAGTCSGARLACLLAAESRAAVQGGPPRGVCAAVLFSCPVDLDQWYEESPGARPCIRALTGERRPGERSRSASPIGAITKDSAPMIIIHGTDDDFLPISQARALEAKLEGLGRPTELIEVAGARHGFGLNYQGHSFFPSILAFLERVWKHNDPVAELGAGSRIGKTRVAGRPLVVSDAATWRTPLSRTISRGLSLDALGRPSALLGAQDPPGAESRLAPVFLHTLFEPPDRLRRPTAARAWLMAPSGPDPGF